MSQYSSPRVCRPAPVVRPEYSSSATSRTSLQMAHMHIEIAQKSACPHHPTWPGSSASAAMESHLCAGADLLTSSTSGPAEAPAIAGLHHGMNLPGVECTARPAGAETIMFEHRHHTYTRSRKHIPGVSPETSLLTHLLCRSYDVRLRR